jgi:oxygen-independent coproporphyrinogen-3 oxidase
MAGIYIHIPFCKQACHYCDFHFSTSVKHKARMVDALCKEIELRKEEIDDEIQTIYFGGGTPSLLTSEEIEHIIDIVKEHYEVSQYAEITIEANPDDLSETVITELANSSVNRLSIGVQSFFEEDLQLMNRAHNAEEAVHCIELTKAEFENYSIDLIYGIPGMTEERWLENLEKALAFDVPHISCYALTVEPKTALEKFIEKGIVAPVNDEIAQKHHEVLVTDTEKAGLDNYEFSNFGKPGFYSENNMGYWHGESYIGIGPSAHSYNGESRSWNVANNTKYMKAIEAGTLPLEREMLSAVDKYNEYVMTRLRTMWGISLSEVQQSFGSEYYEHLLKHAEPHISTELLLLSEGFITVTKKGKFLSDGIASDLFQIGED